MNRSKALAIAPFVSFFLMFAYLFAIRELGDPRAQDLQLKDGEMRWFETLWLTATLFGVIWIWLRSLWRSFHARQIGWLILIFFAWPAAAFYVWRAE
jgi:hypothetical protein